MKKKKKLTLQNRVNIIFIAFNQFDIIRLKIDTCQDRRGKLIKYLKIAKLQQIWKVRKLNFKY